MRCPTHFQPIAILWLLASLAIVPDAANGSEPSVKSDSRPNVVLVITDDQGYGDLACHGNPIIQTPNIDRLFSESSSLSNYHVAPTCSPTRSALMTGHWTNRTGVWHTINGRSMLRADEVTMGTLFKDAGYQTGMFGKWHLGDNYPYRPEDRGFIEVYRHGGGGVGQTPDVWDNSYFDGAYFHNQKIEPANGFCTDVFFDKAHDFIRDCAGEKKPFLAYISTNAPHGPLHCPKAYLAKYEDQPANIASFFGMITNIDDNVGATRDLLKDLGIADNTIFIFTTDNGTATGANVFNAGMRGRKGSEYDGGHRVPFMCNWPAAGWNKKYVNGTLAHAVDVVPTLLSLCGIEPPAKLKFDGMSIKALLDPTFSSEWGDRMLVTDSQRVRDPIKWRKSAVMSQGWRLVNGTELYDMYDDPGQKNNVADQHPERVAKMRQFYEEWWTELEPTFSQTTEIYLGHEKALTATLTAHDWIQNSGPPWNQAQIRRGGAYASRNRRGKNAKEPTNLKHSGHWAVKVIQPGKYSIEVRRWPAEADQPIRSAVPAGENVPGASKAFRTVPGTAINVSRADLRVDGKVLQKKKVSNDDRSVTFTTNLTAGSHELGPYFVSDRGEVGCFYAIVRKVD